LVEIDALVALAIGIEVDELLTVYLTQFPVLAGYDRAKYAFDRQGRQVPSVVLSQWRKQEGGQEHIDATELRAAHPGSGVEYEYAMPFTTIDRAQNLRRAFAEFQRRLASRAENSE